MIDPFHDDPIEERDDSSPEPEVVPAISSEQPAIAAGVGAAYVGRTQDVDGEPGSSRDRDLDQESHVAPTDNDGETVPR